MGSTGEKSEIERELLWSDWIVQLSNSEANFGSDVRFDIWDEQVGA